MAAKPGGRHQGLLQIDGIADFGRGETGTRQGFQRHIGGVTLVAKTNHGQADAVGGNGVAQLDVAKIQRRRVDCERHVLALAAQRGKGSHRFDNSGKHADHLDDDGAGSAPDNDWKIRLSWR